MAQDATIISASLNDSELKQSVDSLVQYVKDGTDRMVKTTDKAVEDMKRAIQSLNSVGSVSDGGSSKRTKKQQDETQAVKETTAALKEQKVTYDQVAQAQQIATRKPSTAQESYQTFVKNMRENVALLAMEIKNMPEWTLSKQIQAHEQYERQIEKSKQKIAELRQQMAELGKDPTNNRLAMQQTLAQISTEQQRINALTKEQILEVQRLSNTNKQELAEKQAQYELERKRLVEMSAGEGERAKFEHERTREYETQLQKINEINSAKEAKKVYTDISFMPINSLETAQQKIAAIQALLNKVNGTPLLSKSNIKDLENALASAKLQLRSYEGQTEKSAEAQKKLGDYVSQSADRQERLRQELIQTGLQAQKSVGRVAQEMMNSMDDAPNKPIQKLQELRSYIDQMHSAFWNMSKEERESPVGVALKNDIAIAREAVKMVERYNAELFLSQRRDVRGVTQRSSLDSLRKALSELTAQYQRLTIAEINEGKGDELIKKFQNVSRAAQVLQRTLSRPIDLKSAMGLQANTLDEIAYKIQMLQAYRGNLNIYDQKQAQEINEVNNELKNLEKTQNDILGRNKSMMESNNALARSFNYMKNRLAFYFTVGASTAFVKKLVEIRSQYELAERSLGILIRSAERGSEVFKQLSDMSLISPYTLIELTNAARQLTAYGVAAKDVVDTTRRLADISAAVGAPVERIAYALGHVQSYGYLTSLQARQFANSGIPLIKELANRYSELEGRMVTSADVYDRMKKKQVEYADVMAVVNKMTDEGGKFYDFQAKQAETLKVQLANLNLAWNNMLNDMGKDNQGLLTGTISALKSVFLAWKDINKAIWDVIWTVGVFKGLQFIVLLFGGGLKEARGWSLLLGASLQKLAASAISATAALATNPFTWVAVAVTSLVSLTRHVLQVKEAAIEMNRELAKSAKEASDSMDKYLSGEQVRENRKKNKEGVLSSADAAKTWETLREQIELSSDNSDVFISKLLKIEDTNKRLTAAFDIADKIQEATSKLSGLNEEAFKVSQDSWLYGLFGEGLGEDLDDFISDVLRKSNTSKFTQHVTEWLGVKDIFDQQSKDEAKAEMENLAKELADVLRDRLGADVKNETILSESIERFRKIIKDKNPQIKGEVANFFDVKLDELLGKEFEGVYNKQTSLQRGFLNILKRDYGATFEGITDNILKENAKWGEEQINAIKKAAEAYKKITVPEFHSAIDDMVRYMNRQDWRIRIAAVFNVNDSTKFQREFDKRVGDKFGVMLLESYRKYRPTKDQDLYEWADKNAEALDKLRKELKSYSKDSSEYSKERKKDVLDEINERTALANIWNQATTKNKNNSKKKDPVLDSLKTEISLVEKLQGDYEKLTKAGASSKDALNAIHNAYGSTIDLLNKNLQGFGLPRLDLSMITGKNPNEQLNYFKELKSLLESKGLANLERIKALDAVIEKLNVKAETYNLDMVTKGLNNELGKLKEEYELGVEFDANPELGDVFADMIGIDKSELAALPRSYEEFIANAQERINKLFADNNIKLDFNLQDNLNMSKFDEWVKNSGQEVDSKLVDDLKKYVSEANKIRLNETKKQIEEWDKLLSKYAEYEYKKLQIEKDYQREMEVARKKGADDDIKRAIQNNRDREMAKVNFEQFQQTPTWVTATGDLATMTNDALNILIDRIEEYKRTAKDLDPKQITEINKALRRLRTEQRKDSPFAIIANAVDEAKERFDDYQVQIDQAGERIDELNAKLQKESYLTESETNELTDLIEKVRKWRKEQEDVGEISAKTIVQGISNIIGAATQAGNAIADMLGAFGDKQGQEDMKAMMGAFDKAAQFAQIGASIGGGYGAIIGGVAGFFTGMVTGLIDILSGNREITKKIEALDRNISRLDITMKNLEFDANNAYGAMVEGMRKAVVESKRLQLAETERQLQLALSRKAKNRDEDEIINLQSKVSDLRREVVEGTQDIVNELLGISNAGDGITQLVQTMIDAFKNGEDAMEAFGNKWDEMIDNMILKLIVTEYMQRGWDKIMEILRQKEDEFLSKAANDKAYAQTVLENMGSLSLDEQKKYLADLLGINSIIDPSKAISDESVENYINSMKSLLENSTAALDDASLEYDKWALEYMTNEGRDFMQQWAQGLYESLPDWYTFGQDSEKQLSNLQQGIQGITEDTAGALEAMLNGISQQVYGHTDLLTEIRDIIHTFDFDVQLGVQSQILLQIQQSSQIQMAIQSILQGWSNPSGQAVRVEMI